MIVGLNTATIAAHSITLKLFNETLHNTSETLQSLQQLASTALWKRIWKALVYFCESYLFLEWRGVIQTAYYFPKTSVPYFGGKIETK